MNERRAILELERGINRLLTAFGRTQSHQRKLRKIRVPEHQPAGVLALTGFGHLTIDELLARAPQGDGHIDFECDCFSN